MAMIIFVVFSILALASAGEELVDYYENLINEELERLATYQFPKDASAYRPRNIKPKDYGTYDFVVVGAGSAGAVAASRLSEVSKWSVLLLEAGKEENDFTDIPGMFLNVVSSDYNWGYNSTPQSRCCQAVGGVCPFPRGKSIGGSTIMNALIYSRGNKLDYDKWGRLGSPNWSYDQVLPYFIKSENSQVLGDAGYHGFGGYLNVERISPPNPKIDVFLAAHQELGRPTIDVNGQNQIGASFNNFNTLKGRRLSAGKTFLQPAQSRPNLKILTESYVEKVLIDTSKMTTGVLFSHKNTRYVVRINKEVVLSAGVVGSPRILMHSGIGVRNQLEELNISVVEDLEVGYHMHDHTTFNIIFATNTSETLYSLRDSIKQYLNGTGPLTTAGNPQGISFVQLIPNRFTQPDYELMMIPDINLNSFVTSERKLLDDDVRNYLARSPHQELSIALMVLILLHPKMRGRVYLESSDPFVYPIIDSQCLSDDQNEDMEKLYQGVLKVVELLETKAFKDIDAQILSDPQCAHHGIKSKEYWLCAITLTAMNAYHGGGTCQMRSSPRRGGVVDDKLKVFGVRRLRVADTSVIPMTISGHTSASAMMIGERIADFIKRSYEENG